MVKILILLAFIPQVYCSTEQTKHATTNAINVTRKAVMAVPVVRTVVQNAGEEAMKIVGLTKEQAAYIAPLASVVQGRVTTKYIKGFRWRDRNRWSLVPLLEYNFREDTYRTELTFFYAF
jgi:hypothetical protein